MGKRNRQAILKLGKVTYGTEDKADVFQRALEPYFPGIRVIRKESAQETKQ